MFGYDRDLITELKQKDAHFKKVFDKHNDLDNEISKIETSGVYNDIELETMKKEKLVLKDELQAIITKYKK